MTETTQTGARSPFRPLPCHALLAVFTAFILVVVAVNPDGKALLAFKAGLDDPTGILNSWNDADPYPCSWDGVTCNENLRVQLILLQDTQLSGPIAPVLRNLSELRTLVLSRNNFFGPLPSEVGQIGSLWKLNVSDNALSGSLPSSLGNLSRLRMLDLSKNAFTGEIPPNLFRYCETLRYVSLAENGFTGVIPDTLWSCTTLVGVNVALNSLQGTVPPKLGGLVHLEFLDVHRNKLSGAIPLQLALLSNVIYLDFSNNQLAGGIPPAIAALKLLNFVDFSNNPIGGSVPSEIGGLTALERMGLSNMSLQGNIPASLVNLTSLQNLDMSTNNLTGAIPPELGQIAAMQDLFLQNNSLNSTIPASLVSLLNLTGFNVSYNRLSGRIPTTNAFSRFDNSSYLGNSGLCGPPLSLRCELESSPEPRVHTDRRLLSVSALVAIAAAGFIALGVVIIALLSIWAMRKQNQQPKTEILVYESTPPSPDVNPIIGKLVLFNNTLPTRFEDWETGTKALLNKECLIGRGSLGTVYRATFDDGLSIAIKKLETLGRIKNAEEFESEMDNLGDVRHTNIVTLQGYYWSSSMQLMLSDHIANRTLASHLHQQPGGQTSLVWSRRFRIAIGIARGLSCLHHDLRPQVLHLNLSSMNILLDQSFEPKISDFGLMKLLPILDTYAASRKSLETRVYSAPELLGPQPSVTPKCDVYSYGMVLLELMTGRHPDSKPDGGPNALVELVIRTLESGNGPNCFDPKLTSFPESEVVQVLKLALVCTSQVASNRPTMGEAVQVLESIKPSGSWTSRSPSP